MICVSEIFERCEKLQPITNISDSLAREFVEAIDLGLSIGFVYDCIGFSSREAKRVIRRSKVMMSSPVINAICVTKKRKAIKTKAGKPRLVFSGSNVFGLFSDAKAHLLENDYKWLVRRYGHAKFGKNATPNGVLYIKQGWLAVVETIKPHVFFVSIYEVS